MLNKKIDINLILTFSILFVIGFVYLVFPNLEFKSPNTNRVFGIVFNVFCFYSAILIFIRLKKIKSKILKYFMGLITGIFLLLALLNFPIYLMKIDPQVQYYDIETLYWNKTNKFEKIQKQYYINWKNNQKNIIINKVFDFGPFRNYLEYRVEIENLDENWVKTNGD